MIRMFNKLPYFVYLKNEKYFINTDYRIFVEFEIKMQGKDNEKVIYNTLNKFYPAFFKILDKGLLNEAVDKFIWFYFCGKDKEQIKNEDNNKKRVQKKDVRIYDYDYDCDLIWSAYFDKGIDLTTNKLHWWKFRALFKSLDENCEFRKVMGYRSYEGKDKDMLKLKELNKLPLSEFEEIEKERHNKIFDELNKISS